MGSDIYKSFIEQYNNNVLLLVQQKGSKQRKSVNNIDVKGRSSYIEAIGSVDVQPITTRHAATPILDTPYSRRQLLLGDFSWGDMIDDVDRVRMLIDPTSTYVRNATYAFGREMDDIIIRGLLGTARAGMTGETNVVLPDTQKIGLSSDITMDVDTILAAKRIFDDNDVDPDEPRYIALGPQQLQDLLGNTEVQNINYNSVKALVQGQVDTFLGFKFIMTTRLKKTVDNKRRCIAYTRDSFTLGIGREPVVKMAESTSRSFNLQLYVAMSLGGVRVQEAQVVEIQCKEAA